MGLDPEGTIVKQLSLSHSSGASFTITLRILDGDYRVTAENSPPDLAANLRQLLVDASASPIPRDRISEEWRVLIEAFQAAAWTPHQVLTSSFQISLTDPRLVSRIESPSTPSDELRDLQQRMHQRVGEVFGNAASEAATEIRRLVSESKHVEAFAALKKAEGRLICFLRPSRDLVAAICLIDPAVLSPDDAFHLWEVRISQKSRARLYKDLEDDIRTVERAFADRVTPARANGLLLIRGELAEHSARPEVAYARYRELLGREGLSPILRAHAYWGAFRVSAPEDRDAPRLAQHAADAFLEAGDRGQAVRCFAAAAQAFEVTDYEQAIPMVDRALRTLEGDDALTAATRAALLHTRAGMRLDRGELDAALKDANDAVDTRRALTGVEAELISSLHLVELIASRQGKTEESRKLRDEIDLRTPGAGADATLRARILKTPREDIDQLRRLHDEVVKQNDPRLEVDSLLGLALATQPLDVAEAIGCLESALEIARRTPSLRRDAELHALIESAIGQFHFMTEDWERAIDWYKRALAHDPREATARQNLGALLLRDGRFVELGEFTETQLQVFGDLPGLLLMHGRALLGLGRPAAASQALYRAKTVCEDPTLLKLIEEWLSKAMAEPQEAEPRRTPPPARSRAVTREEFHETLKSFGAFVKAERRMSFWRPEGRGHKFVASPEQHAKVLLHAFLRGRLGDGVLILDEVVAGAGLIDLWIEVPGGSRFVVELKMCGESYAASYAEKGIEQLTHYMENKRTHLGYLVVFDARRRDFGKGIEAEIKDASNTITTIFVDVRPEVTAGGGAGDNGSA